MIAKTAQVSTSAQPNASGRRTVKVSKSTVAAARGRVLVATKLGRPVSKATVKIANAH